MRGQKHSNETQVFEDTQVMEETEGGEIDVNLEGRVTVLCEAKFSSHGYPRIGLIDIYTSIDATSCIEVSCVKLWVFSMVIQRPIVTPRPTRADPSSHARGRERSIARKNLARPMRARRRRRRRDGSLRRHSATGRRDAGDASERGGVRTRRDATVRQDASRPCSSTTTTTRAGPADAHHTRTSRIDATRGTRARASHRIASIHPSIVSTRV